MKASMRTLAGNSLVRGLALVAALVSCAPPAAAQVVEYYHLDGLGSVRAVSNQAGVVVEQRDYLPFGEEWCGTAVCAPSVVAAGQPRRFTGKERDAETGLDYFGARYYGAKLGRFTSIDPVYTWQDNLVDPQRWNRYAYVRGNPLRYVDPDGKVGITVNPETGEIEPVLATFWDEVGTTTASGIAKTINNVWWLGFNSPGCTPTRAYVDEHYQAPESMAERVVMVTAEVALVAATLPRGKAGIPDEAFVVRGGVATPKQIAAGIGPHREVPGLVGFSAQSRAGATVEELAATGGVGNKPFPHGKVSVTTAGKLRCIGCKVVQSPGAGANHVTVVPGGATANQISNVFVPQPNPSRH